MYFFVFDVVPLGKFELTTARLKLETIILDSFLVVILLLFRFPIPLILSH